MGPARPNCRTLAGGVRRCEIDGRVRPRGRLTVPVNVSAMADHPIVRLETLALIGIGGFAGSNLRYFALGLFSDVQAVLLVNVLGCFALGFLVYEAEYSGLVARRSRTVFTTGFLSSLTTYSTFAIQSALSADPLLLVAIVAGNYGLGFTAVLASRVLARRLRDDATPSAGGETA